jgi:hypothetical protein
LPNEETYFAKAKPLSKMDFNIFYWCMNAFRSFYVWTKVNGQTDKLFAHEIEVLGTHHKAQNKNC